MPQIAQVNGKNLQVSTQPTLVLLPNFSPIAASTVSTLSLPLNQSYLRIWLKFTKSDGTVLTDAQIASAFTNIQLIIDGDPVWNLSALQLQMLIQHWMGVAANGAASVPIGHFPLTPNVGTLLLPFARSWQGSNIKQEEAAALGTADRKNVTIQLTQASGGLAVKCVAFAEVDINYNLGRYIAIRPFTIQVSGTGLLQIFNQLPQDGNKQLCALHLNVGSSNAFDYFSILPDGQTPMLNQIQLTVWQSMMETYGYIQPQPTAWANLQFIRRNRNTDSLNLGNRAFTIQIDFTTVAAPYAMPYLAEISEIKPAA